MIKIKYKKENSNICEVEVSGHAGFAPHGEDIVCASVSSIVATTINAIVRLDSDAIEYTEEEGFVKLNVLKQDPTINTLLTNMIELFNDLEKKYNKFIKIY